MKTQKLTKEQAAAQRQFKRALKEANPRAAAQECWRNATSRTKLTPLMRAIKRVIDRIPCTLAESRRSFGVYKFSKRIADQGQRTKDNHAGNCPALGYQNDWHGEWYVSNNDCQVFGDFGMWISRIGFDPLQSTLQHEFSFLRKALTMMRMQQAYDRFQKTGLRREHCILLSEMGWEMDVFRGDWVSLHVQGKRPFGNSGTPREIHAHLGWRVLRLWDENGLPDVAKERAWNIFDELVFAAPELARRMALKLPKK